MKKTNLPPLILTFVPGKENTPFEIAVKFVEALAQHDSESVFNLLADKKFGKEIVNELLKAWKNEPEKTAYYPEKCEEISTEIDNDKAYVTFFDHNLIKGKEFGKNKTILHKINGIWHVCYGEMFMAAWNGKL